MGRHEAPDAGLDDRARVRFTAAVASARRASTRHVSLAVPFRAAERNRRVAASVLAGGIAYRLFLWLLPFGLIRRGRARPHGCGQHRGGPCERRSSCGRRRHDRRRRASRGIRLVVAPRDRRAAPPLGGIHGRESGAAHSLAHLGRAPSADQAVEELTCLHGRAVRLHGRSSRSRGGFATTRRSSASSRPRSPRSHSPRCGSGLPSAFRTGTLPGGRCYPARSSSRSALRCSTG